MSLLLQQPTIYKWRRNLLKNNIKSNHLFVFLFLILFSLVDAENNTRVAVCNFKTNDKSIEHLGWQVSELIGNRIVNLGGFDVIERDQIEKVLSEQGRQLQDYSDRESVIEFGNILGANRIIVGSIFKTGTVLNVSARLVDVESGKILKSESVEGKYYSEIPNLCDMLTFKLLDINFNESDYKRDIIQATGQGFPPKNMIDINKAKMMAKRAAVIDAKRNLIEEIKGIYIDSNTIINDHIIKNDIISVKVNGIINNVEIVNITYNSDGSVEVILELDKDTLIKDLKLETLKQPN